MNIDPGRRAAALGRLLGSGKPNSHTPILLGKGASCPMSAIATRVPQKRTICSPPIPDIPGPGCDGDTLRRGRACPLLKHFGHRPMVCGAPPRYPFTNNRPGDAWSYFSVPSFSEGVSSRRDRIKLPPCQFDHNVLSTPTPRSRCAGANTQMKLAPSG